MESPDIIQWVTDIGTTGVLAWAVFVMKRDIDAMRQEATEQRNQIWLLLEYLVKQSDPGFQSGTVGARWKPQPPPSP